MSSPSSSRSDSPTGPASPAIRPHADIAPISTKLLVHTNNQKRRLTDARNFSNFKMQRVDRLQKAAASQQTLSLADRTEMLDAFIDHQAAIADECDLNLNENNVAIVKLREEHKSGTPRQSSVLIFRELRKVNLSAINSRNKALSLKRTMVQQRNTLLQQFAAPSPQQYWDLLQTVLNSSIRKARGAKSDTNAYYVGQRSKADQHAFRDTAIHLLGFGRQEDKRRSGVPTYKLVWCPISGKFLPSDFITAAHIIPYSTSQQVLTSLFGAEDSDARLDNIWNTGNCLPMVSTFEKALDKAWFVIVPAPGDFEDETVSPRYQLRLNDLQVKKATVAMHDGTVLTWGALDGRILQWPTDARPRARFLYVRFAFSYFYAKQEAWLGRGGPDYYQHTGAIWASPGRYVRAGSLICLGASIGDYSLCRPLQHNLIEELAGTTPDAGQQATDQDAADELILLNAPRNDELDEFEGLST